MLNQLQQLSLKTRDELEHIANKLGLVVTPSEQEHDIADRIALVTTQIAPSKLGLVGAIEENPDEPFSRKEMMIALSGHIKAGLKVKIEDGSWYFSYGLKSDSGTLQQPLKVILRCASAIIQSV